MPSTARSTRSRPRSFPAQTRRRMLALRLIHELVGVSRGFSISTWSARHDRPPGGDDQGGDHGGTGSAGLRLRAITRTVVVRSPGSNRDLSRAQLGRLVADLDRARVDIVESSWAANRGGDVPGATGTRRMIQVWPGR